MLAMQQRLLIASGGAWGPGEWEIAGEQETATLVRFGNVAVLEPQLQH